MRSVLWQGGYERVTMTDLEQFRAETRAWLDEKKLKTLVPVARQSGTRDHHTHADIAAHRVNCDSRPHTHRLFPLIACKMPSD